MGHLPVIVAAGNRSRDRSDLKNRIAVRRFFSACGLDADRIGMNLIATPHQHDDLRIFAAFNIAGRRRDLIHHSSRGLFDAGDRRSLNL